MIAYTGPLGNRPPIRFVGVDVNHSGPGSVYHLSMAWPAHPPPGRPPAWPPGMPPPMPPMPPPLPPPEPDGTGWMMVPLVTLGLGAPFSFLYAGVRHRSMPAAVSGVVYGGALTMAFGAPAVTGSAALGVLLVLITWIASTVHAIAARPRLYPPPDPRERLNRQAVAMSKRRRRLREEARRIVADDPVLARELRIGRPDLLPRAYDDGGLVDMNHAPPQALVTVPGLTPDMVFLIVRTRAEHGPFVSAEELALCADLPPDVVPALTEYGLFVT